MPLGIGEPARAVATPEAAADDPPRPTEPPAASEELPRPARPAWRRRLAFLKRPAEFVRGFLQAPVHNRIDRVDQALDRAAARQAESQHVLVQQVLQLASILQRQVLVQQTQLARQDETLATLRALVEQQSLRAQAQDASRDAWRGDVHLRLDRIDQLLAAVEARASLLASVVGPRFDELEIKVRPLVPYDDQSTAVRLADGYVMAPKDDPVVLTMLADAPSGGFEPGVRQVIRSLVQPGMRVADVGANLGLLTLAAARATGPAGKVYAFEPEARPRAQLLKMLHQNGLTWVEPHPVALGRAPGVAAFHESAILGHSSLYALPEAESAGVVEVPVETLDRVLAGAPVDVVKIDVEGAELDVLAGMGQALARNRDLAVIVEYGPSHLQRVGISSEAWFEAFAAHDLQAYRIEEPTGRCRRLTIAERKRIQRQESTNLVFVRRGGAAERRLPR